MIWKEITKTSRYRYTGQQPETKSGRRPADKPVVNQTFCFSTGFSKNSFVRTSEKTFKTVVFDALKGKRDGRLLSEPIRRRSVLLRLFSPSRPSCAVPPLLARDMFGFGIRQRQILCDANYLILYHSQTFILSKRYVKTNRRQFTGQQPRTMSCCRSANKLRVNRTKCICSIRIL